MNAAPQPMEATAGLPLPTTPPHSHAAVAPQSYVLSPTVLAVFAAPPALSREELTAAAAASARGSTKAVEPRAASASADGSGGGQRKSGGGGGFMSRMFASRPQATRASSEGDSKAAPEQKQPPHAVPDARAAPPPVIVGLPHSASSPALPSATRGKKSSTVVPTNNGVVVAPGQPHAPAAAQPAVLAPPEDSKENEPAHPSVSLVPPQPLQTSSSASLSLPSLTVTGGVGSMAPSQPKPASRGSIQPLAVGLSVSPSSASGARASTLPLLNSSALLLAPPSSSSPSPSSPSTAASFLVSGSSSSSTSPSQSPTARFAVSVDGVAVHSHTGGNSSVPAATVPGGPSSSLSPPSGGLSAPRVPSSGAHHRTSIAQYIDAERRHAQEQQYHLHKKRQHQLHTAGGGAASLQSLSVVYLPRGGIYVHTPAGPVQFGMPPETIKDSMRLGLTLPAFFIVPKERFNLQAGINVAEFEFPAYYNFFFKRRRINLIVTKAVEPLIRTIFRETLLGPSTVEWPAEYGESVPKRSYPDLAKEMSYFSVNPFDRSPLTVDSLLAFTHFDERGRVQLDHGVAITDEGEEYVVTAQVRTEGSAEPVTKEIARVRQEVFSTPVMDEPPPQPQPQPPPQHLPPTPKPSASPSPPPSASPSPAAVSPSSSVAGAAAEYFVPPHFGLTMLGNSDGFDSGGTTTGFVLWMNRRGIMVDPPPHSGALLKRHGISARLMRGVILTHCFPEVDTRVLTNRGLLFLDEIERRQALREEVLFGCYEVKRVQGGKEVESKQLRYVKGKLRILKEEELPTELVEFASPGEGKRWTEESGPYGKGMVAAQAKETHDTRDSPKRSTQKDAKKVKTKQGTKLTELKSDDDNSDDDSDDDCDDDTIYSRHVSLRVTPDHEMFVQTGNKKTRGDVTWSSTRKWDPVTKKGGPVVERPHRKVQAQELLSTDRRASVRLLACAEGGFLPPSISRREAVRTWLRLTSVEFTAFLELFGFWLGDGSMSYATSQGGYNGVRFYQVKGSDRAWLTLTLGKVGLRRDVDWMSFVSSNERREDMLITAPHWFALFDEVFGRKYKHSQYYVHDANADTAAGAANQEVNTDHCQPPSPLSLTRSPPSTPLSSSASSSSSSPTSSTSRRSLTSTSKRRRSALECWTPPTPSLSASRSTTPSASTRSSLSLTRVKEEAEMDVIDLTEEEEKKDVPMEDEEKDDDEEEDDELPPEWIKSVKWLPEWALAELSRDEMRLVIEGLRRADGTFAQGDKVIYTSSSRLRDQLMHAMLHCGYSSWSTLMYRAGTIRGYSAGDRTLTIEHFNGLTPSKQRRWKPIIATVDAWHVSWTEASSQSGKGSCWPSMPRRRCVTTLKYDAERDKRIWCVDVDHPDHLIIAQRAERNSDGVVTKQSRPIIVGNCHADHDAGTFQKILEEGKVVLMTTEVILDSFLRKYSAISGLDASFLRKLFVFRPVLAGQRTAVYGGHVEFFYSLHSIPCVGFAAHCNGRSMVYSGDSFNDPAGIQRLFEQGYVSEGRRDALIHFPWHHDLILHEAGVPPIHTPLSTLEALPEDVKARLYIVHKPSKDVPTDKGLKSALVGPEHTLVINSAPPANATALEVLDLLSGIDMFSGFDLSRALEILQCATFLSFQRGETLIAEGTYGDPYRRNPGAGDSGAEGPPCFYVIAMGTVCVSQDGEVIKQLTVGDHFGEMSIVTGEKRTASIKALTPVEVIQFSKQQFLYIVRHTDAITRLQQLGVIQRSPSWQVITANSSLSQLSSAQKTYLQSLFIHRVVRKGDTVWQAGETATEAVLIADGQFYFSRAQEQAPFKRGALVGEMKALIAQSALTTTLQCSEDGSVYAISRLQLNKFFDDNPGVKIQFKDRRFIE